MHMEWNFRNDIVLQVSGDVAATTQGCLLEKPHLFHCSYPYDCISSLAHR